MQQATNLTLCRRVCIVTWQSVAAGETETNWNFVVGRVIDSGVVATSTSCTAILRKRNLNEYNRLQRSQFPEQHSVIVLNLFDILKVVPISDYVRKLLLETDR